MREKVPQPRSCDKEALEEVPGKCQQGPSRRRPPNGDTWVRNADMSQEGVSKYISAASSREMQFTGCAQSQVWVGQPLPLTKLPGKAYNCLAELKRSHIECLPGVRLISTL